MEKQVLQGPASSWASSCAPAHHAPKSLELLPHVFALATVSKLMAPRHSSPCDVTSKHTCENLLKPLKTETKSETLRARLVLSPPGTIQAPYRNRRNEDSATHSTVLAITSLSEKHLVRRLSWRASFELSCKWLEFLDGTRYLNWSWAASFCRETFDLTSWDIDIMKTPSASTTSV